MGWYAPDTCLPLEDRSRHYLPLGDRKKEEGWARADVGRCARPCHALRRSGPDLCPEVSLRLAENRPSSLSWGIARPTRSYQSDSRRSPSMLPSGLCPSVAVALARGRERVRKPMTLLRLTATTASKNVQEMEA